MVQTPKKCDGACSRAQEPAWGALCTSKWMIMIRRNAPNKRKSNASVQPQCKRRWSPLYNRTPTQKCTRSSSWPPTVMGEAAGILTAWEPQGKLGGCSLQGPHIWCRALNSTDDMWSPRTNITPVVILPKHAQLTSNQMCPKWGSLYKWPLHMSKSSNSKKDWGAGRGEWEDGVLRWTEDLAKFL